MRFRYFILSLLSLGAAPAAVAQPDLTVLSASSEDPSGAPGDRPNLSYTVANTGNAQAGESAVGFYFSTDQTLSSDDVFAESEDIDEVDAGDSEEDDEQITVPKGLSPGNYFIIVSADDNNVVTESNESNNTFAIPFEVTGMVSSETAADRAGLSLDAPFPNPVAGEATIRYSLRDAGVVRLAVYDALGRQVAALVDGNRAAGTHAAVWSSATASTGLYVVRLESGDGVASRRMAVVR